MDEDTTKDFMMFSDLWNLYKKCQDPNNEADDYTSIRSEGRRIAQIHKTELCAKLVGVILEDSINKVKC